MLTNYLVSPSLTSLFITGMILFSILILLIRNFKELMREKIYDKIAILCMLSIAIGSHGLIHLGVEKQYGFNPYKWI